MPEALLVINAGSSSLKFATFTVADPPELLLRGKTEEPPGAPLSHEKLVGSLLDRVERYGLGGRRLAGVGHRVVHGGVEFAEPRKVDEALLARLDALVPLAPLHQPHNLAAIRAVAARVPDMPQVACFDTAFHRSQPAVAQAFAIPRRFTDAGVKRYGFHGLSYEWIASRLGEIDPRAARGRTIVAHLGNGASLCAMRAGASVATTMSFTALDGLVMGTRGGSIDPGVLLYLMESQSLSAADLSHLLWNESGLLGVSGISSDMRELLASEDPRAKEAVDLFVYRAAREIGSLAAALGGLDALVFTAGIGENAAAVRARICRESAWLGLDLDEESNAAGGPRLSRAESRVSAWVVPTDEEAMIARHTRSVLGRPPG